MTGLRKTLRCSTTSVGSPHFVATSARESPSPTSFVPQRNVSANAGEQRSKPRSSRAAVRFMRRTICRERLTDNEHFPKPACTYLHNVRRDRTFWSHAATHPMYGTALNMEWAVRWIAAGLSLGLAVAPGARAADFDLTPAEDHPDPERRNRDPRQLSRRMDAAAPCAPRCSSTRRPPWSSK
jgi:hypothetical protein